MNDNFNNNLDNNNRRPKPDSDADNKDFAEFEREYSRIKSERQANSDNDDASDDFDAFEQEYSRIKNERQPFNLDIDNKIKNIPDYYAEAATTKNRSSHFAKIMLAITIVGMSILLSIVIIFSAMEILAIKKPSRVVVLDVPEKSGVADIADLLEQRGVIDSAFIFKAYFKLFASDISLNFGTYELNSDMSYDEIIGNMQQYSAAQDEVTVTFPEGLTIYEMAKKLEQSKVCTAKEFIAELNSKSFGYDFEQSLTPNALKFHKMEGYLFPDTYNFYENDKAFNVAKKMVKEFDKKVTTEMREKMQAMGYTLEQTITIASIVQKEAGKTSEMRKVASVYHNRLNNKDIYPNLQACPTRDYANELKTQMSVIDQKIIDAYNTYEDAGLPPGPICNPGVDAIAATLNPEITEYFYFCSDKSGNFYYGKTLQEHERNIRKAGLV